MNAVETDSCRLQAGGIGLTCWHAACRYWRLCVGRALIPSFHWQESPHGPQRWPAAAWAPSVSSRCTMYGHIYIHVNKHTHFHSVHTLVRYRKYTQARCNPERRWRVNPQLYHCQDMIRYPAYVRMVHICSLRFRYLIEALRDSGTKQLSSKMPFDYREKS